MFTEREFWILFSALAINVAGNWIYDRYVRPKLLRRPTAPVVAPATEPHLHMQTQNYPAWYQIAEGA